MAREAVAPSLGLRLQQLGVPDDPAEIENPIGTFARNQNGGLIVIANREQTDVSFVFFSTKISKLVLILLCVGIGFAAGYLFAQLRDRRRRGHWHCRWRCSSRSSPR